MNWNVLRRALPTELRTETVAVLGVALLGVTLLTPETTATTLLRLLLALAFVTVLPGFGVLRIAGIYEVRPRTVLYAAGTGLVVTTLSLSALNFAFTNSLESTPIAFTVVGVTAAVWSAGYRRPPATLVANRLLDRQAVFLLLFPILGALGAKFQSWYGTSTVALAFIGLACTVPLLVALDVLDRRTYPFALYCVSLGVLYHTNLVSPYIWAFDSHYQFHVSRTILESHNWVPVPTKPLTTIPLIVLFNAAFSALVAIPLVDVFKFVSPVLYALAPVAIYFFAETVLGDRRAAALSAFTFPFFYGFFKGMPGKQGFAELFIVLALLVLFAERDDSRYKWFAAVFFTGAVLAHYGVTFVYLLVFVGTLTLRWILRKSGFERPTRTRQISVGVVSVFGSIWFVWFFFLTEGILLESIALIFVSFVENILEGALFTSRSGVTYATKSVPGPLWLLLKLAYVTLVALFGIGWVRAARSRLRGEKMVSDEYLLLTASTGAFLGVSVVFALQTGFDRTLHMTIPVLAPCAYLGCETLESVSFRSYFPSTSTTFALLLVLLFSLGSGGGMALGGEQVPPYSVSLNQQAGWPVYDDCEVGASRWVASSADADGRSVAVLNPWSTVKSRDGLLVSEVVDRDRIVPLAPEQNDLHPVDRDGLDDDVYVYVSRFPVELSNGTPEYDRRTTPVFDALERESVVYHCGSATVYSTSS